MRVGDREWFRYGGESRKKAFKIIIKNPDDHAWEKTKVFPKVKDDILEKMVEEKALDNKFQLMDIYSSMEAVLAKTNGMSFVTYKVIFDHRQYLFSYNKTGGIWQRTSFSCIS